MPGNPLLWLCVALGLALPATYGTLKVLEARRVQVAYDKGVEAGKGQASTATVTAATATAAAERQALEETPLTADKATIIARCKASASCRERGRL
jgi:mevalonate pyrophosphate decarboxylase